MFTPEYTEALFSDVFDRMVAARWIERYTKTEGKGFHVAWSVKGAGASCWLRHWSRSLGFEDADERPRIAGELARGFCPDPRSVADTVRAAFDPYVAAGLMSGYRFVHGLCSDAYWTEKGREFCRALGAMLDELGIAMGDEDRMIVLVQIVEGWAPTDGTPVVEAP